MFRNPPIGLTQFNITPQPAIRQQGFGGHFKDAPPPFIETDEDNKIERKKKPEVKKKKRKKKGKGKGTKKGK
tara:strand:+ start:923 stop:1138 length:216 start_codon:yes stop_codon:yes gene_type:complete